MSNYSFSNPVNCADWDVRTRERERKKETNVYLAVKHIKHPNTVLLWRYAGVKWSGEGQHDSGQAGKINTVMKTLRQAFHSSFHLLAETALRELIKEPLECVLCVFFYVNVLNTSVSKFNLSSPSFLFSSPPTEWKSKWAQVVITVMNDFVLPFCRCNMFSEGPLTLPVPLDVGRLLRPLCFW